jgi:large subunit ribosomal protein LP0
MGKNTMMKKAISFLKEQNPDLQKLLPFLKGTIGLVFTNAELHEVREVIEKNRVGAPAKQGQISPVNVVIPAHNTGLEPTKTSFFQALSIPTKITRGTVDILSDYVLLKPGDKVGNSEASLLQLLNIKPFSYGLTIEKIYDNGSIYGAEVLDITADDLMRRFLDGIANIASVSLETGYPTEAAIPHMLVNGFKNLLAVSVSTDYTFKQAEATKEFLKDPSKFVVAPAKEEAKEEKKVEEKEEEKEEEEEEDADMGLDLFGGDD